MRQHWRDGSGLLYKGIMNAMAFDTHDAANRFKAAGFTEEQVEALVEVTRRTTALPDVSTLATRADLNGEIGSLRSELKTEIASVKTMIASAQVQTITVILTAVAAMLVVSRLIPGGVR
jgi:hypothetical protein